jgi:hypothetical protein
VQQRARVCEIEHRPKPSHEESRALSIKRPRQPRDPEIPRGRLKERRYRDAGGRAAIYRAADHGCTEDCNITGPLTEYPDDVAVEYRLPSPLRSGQSTCRAEKLSPGYGTW